jgi:ubiquinone/menaquinone biosynthesis C-methylase UbiE
MNVELEYGNWVRKKNLFILGLVTLILGLLVLIPFGPLYRGFMLFLFLMMLVSFFLPLYAYGMFSQRGGKLQEKVYSLIIQKLGTNLKGSFLDIGSGNGVLAVKLAREYPEIKVTGMDYWGVDWEYSKEVCDQNARKAGVGDRLRFQRGDAASLDFANETFDGVVSNLTFHEVKSISDKRLVLAEALRVLKPGGVFSFVDYFDESKYYGTASEFQEYLKELRLAQFEYKSLSAMLEIPALLKHPKILGRVGVIYGRK